MKVSVYSLKKVLFEGEAQAVNCQTVGGEITILDFHRPLISMLKAGPLRVTDTGQKDHYFPIVSGFLEVDGGNRAKLLVEEAAELAG